MLNSNTLIHELFGIKGFINQHIGSDQPSLVGQVLHYSLTHRLILHASHGIIEQLDE